jgi:hypothetical protein
MSGTSDGLKEEPISFTTNPKSIFSWNALFNVCVWGAAGGYLGSMVSIPTPEGVYSLTGPGVVAGAGTYAFLVFENQGISKWWQDYQDFIAKSGSHTEPIDQNKVAAFQRKYGVSFWQALDQFKKMHPSIQNPDYNTLIEWCDQFYLQEDPNTIWAWWGLAVDVPRVYLDSSTIKYFAEKFGITLDEATRLYFINTGTPNFTKIDQIPGVGTVAYVKGEDWKKFLLWIYHAPGVNHTKYDYEQTSPILSFNPLLTPAENLKKLEPPLDLHQHTKERYTMKEAQLEFLKKWGNGWRPFWLMAQSDFKKTMLGKDDFPTWAILVWLPSK